MSNLESTWSLHANNNATPKSLAVYTTPPIPSMRSSTTTSAGSRDRMTPQNQRYPQQQNNPQQQYPSTNPFDSRIRNPFGSSGPSSRNAGAGGNPFDVATSSSASTPYNSKSRNNINNPFGMSSVGSTSPTSPSSPSSLSSSSIIKSTYSVIYGTDRGTLHYRTYPNNHDSTKPSNKLGNVTIVNSNIPIQPIGLEKSQNKNAVLHPLYQPMDTIIHDQFSIVSCIRAEPPLKMIVQSSERSRETKSTTDTTSSSHNPIFLILQDKDSNTGRYNSRSSIISTTTSNDSNTVNGQEISKTYEANLITLHQYDGITTKPLSILAELPRMSSASYHELTGYVYTVGSSVYSFPAEVVQSVSSSFTTTSSSGSNSVYDTSTTTTSSTSPTKKYLPKLYYHCTDVLPSCGVRSGYGGISMICNGHVVVIALKNGSFYAVNGMSVPEGFWLVGNNDHHTTNNHTSSQNQKDESNGYGQESKSDVEKVLMFRQSSPVYPAISIEIPVVNVSSTASESSISVEDKTNSGNGGTSTSNDVHTSLVFLASGRECAVVEIMYNPKLFSNNRHMRRGGGHGTGSSGEDGTVTLLPSPSVNNGSIVVGSPRHGIATLASPILAAVGLLKRPLTNTSSSSSSSSSKSCTPLVVILTSDGLVHTRSPSFISIPLSTIEVGNRPNDFFTLQALPNRKVVAGSYSGEARLLSFREDTVQDLADRLVKLSIDAFGSNGFPRAELAEATGATFSATSYVGAEASIGARNMLKQYLETCLGLDMSGDFGGAALYKQFLYGDDDFLHDRDDCNYEASQSIALGSPFAASYLASTAILCLVCTRLGTPNPSLANRAAKSCASKFGLVGKIHRTGINASTVKVCELVAEILLEQSVSTRILPASGGLATGRDGIQMEMVEAASWLLRTCGQHERSLKILQERMSNPSIRNKMYVEDGTEVAGDRKITKYASGWSQSKYDKHVCSHLEELWSSGDQVCQDLVLKSNVTRRLLETNSALGLRIFTTLLPENEKQWSSLSVDPLLDTKKTTDVIELLKSIIPKSKAMKSNINVGSMSIEVNNDFELPLDSGRALAVSYLETAIGITTGKPPSKSSDESHDMLIDIHNELAFLLLEGVLTERMDGNSDVDTDLGRIYREKLRRQLGWHSSKVQPDQIMDALPTSFLREKALLYGQLGRHEDALRIFYLDLKSLDLALEYCDARYEKQQAQNRYQTMKAQSNGGNPMKVNHGCAYLPLVRVALESDQDSERGTAAAIQVLSLRRESIDRAAALRLLPKNIPVSALARSFLIPALIDGESQARRLTVTASLLRAKYNRLKYSLTEAQIKSQSILQNVPALQSLNLGQPVYVSKSFKARPSNMASLHFPEVIITKHFFQRYVIIQATATTSNGMTLGDLKLVVAESSDEALLPSLNVPIKTLPPRISGSSWCVLAASPQRLDGTAILVCEMHYNIMSFDSAANSYHFENGLQSGPHGRSHVEEIQDIEIRRAEFEG